MTNRASFGDVIGEYVALREGCALITGSVDLVWVTGQDATKFLDGLLSQDVGALETGSSTRSLLLTPQGKLRAWLIVARESADRIALLADAGRGGVVVEDLNRFKIRVAADIVAETRPLIEVRGPEAPAVLERSGLAPTEGMVVGRDGEIVVRIPGPTPAYVVAGVDLSVLEKAGAVRAGSIAVDTLRIEEGRPVVGIDIDESTIPQEAHLVDDAVSFTKGCYLGQELVARIDSRGHVNRRLRALTMVDAVIPPRGADIVADEKVVGSITSVGESPSIKAPIAMALVRREVEPGATVVVKWQGGQTEATVNAVPVAVPPVRDGGLVS